MNHLLYHAAYAKGYFKAWKDTPDLLLTFYTGFMVGATITFLMACII